jgi:TonB family protein
MRWSNIVPASGLLLAIAGFGTAHAQYRCDCTSVVDTCDAEVVARGSFLEIKTNEAMCARVDYFVDGQPFVSVVVDGEDRENWLARTTNPRILVQSCQVCRDTGASVTAASQPARAPTAAPAPAAGEQAGAEGEGGLQPLISGVPEYPAAAQARGLRGYVEVEFTVTPAGTVEGARVVTAEPRNVFDAAALASVTRRRYAQDAERAPQVVQERVEFAPPRGAQAAAAAAGPASGPRNQCVRKDAVYNYGDMVDVGLVNACAEPLMVFGCAQGTGKDRGRWVCSNSEQRGDILVPAGDQRLGRRYTAGNAADFRTYTYRDSYSVSRAPNSQVWWVACAESDDDCRSDARLWTRAVSGQDASVDPQARSTISVASSD